MLENLYALIMSGGRGKRFWPMSQPTLPKQFMYFAGHGTLFQQVVANLRQLMLQDRIFTVTFGVYRQLVEAQVPEFHQDNIIVEPARRNTAPCIGLGTIRIAHLNPDATIITLPSDHYIADSTKFINALRAGVEAAEKYDALVTLGVQPTFPHTGYGYIQTSTEIDTIQGERILGVDGFVEKPNREHATKLLETGRCYWNAGIFIWKARVILEQFKRQLPGVYDQLLQVAAKRGSPEEQQFLADCYLDMPTISIDHAIMQHASPILMIPTDMGWTDVGSWSALRALYPSDASGNLVRGESALVDQVSNSTIISDGQAIVIGAKDLIVVQKGNSVLVCAKGYEDHISALVDRLESGQQGRG